jgi:hypothetical protein
MKRRKDRIKYKGGVLVDEIRSSPVDDWQRRAWRTVLLVLLAIVFVIGGWLWVLST